MAYTIKLYLEGITTFEHYLLSELIVGIAFGQAVCLSSCRKFLGTIISTA